MPETSLEVSDPEQYLANLLRARTDTPWDNPFQMTLNAEIEKMRKRLAEKKVA